MKTQFEVPENLGSLYLYQEEYQKALECMNQELEEHQQLLSVNITRPYEERLALEKRTQELSQALLRTLAKISNE